VRALALLPAALLAALAAVAAAPADAARPPSCSFRLGLSALTDGARAQLALEVQPRSLCTVPPKLKDVRVADRRGTIRTISTVHAPGGRAAFRLGPVRSRTRLDVSLRLTARGRVYPLAGKTTVRLRPDLVVTALRVPAQAATGQPFTVTARIAEPTGGVPATANVVLTTGSTTLGTASVQVQPGRRGRVALPVTLPTAGSFPLTLRIVGALPAETDRTNNTASATVAVTEFRFDPSEVLVPSFAGYGAQFNQNVYAAISRNAGVTDGNVVDMEQKTVALGPQLVRIFFQAAALNDPDLMQSFVRTAQLAQRAGATINVTWQGGALPDTTIARFGAVLVDLVKNRGITGLRWVTLQNEVNSTRITMDTYDHWYRVLDGYLSAAGVRSQIRFMGGDLVAAASPLGQTQGDWLTFLGTRMADVLDAYSIHVFWNYWDSGRLVQRLQDVRALADQLPPTGRKPLYVTEYGARGRRNLNGVAYPNPGVWDDGTPLAETAVNAFQHAWFDVLAARLGYVGTIKWDGFYGRYDNGLQDYSLVGPPQTGWPLRPVYSIVRLFTAWTKPGWKVVGVDGASGTKLLAGYAGPAGQLTVVGLDTSGAGLNLPSASQVSYSIGGLPPSSPLQLVVWNQDGLGGLSASAALTTDAAGTATVTVPLQSVFALTTLPDVAQTRRPPLGRPVRSALERT
jgi:hypothetical protein